ncbi:MAG: hypothetical protein V7784_13215 [Oceanospirillaceae bacterium]
MLRVLGNIGNETTVKRTKSSSRIRAKRRTNLEFIADWLTKILPGAGWVEIKSISHTPLAFSTNMGSSLVPQMFLKEYIALFIGLTFAACGLFAGYLWSQLQYDD